MRLEVHILVGLFLFAHLAKALPTPVVTSVRLSNVTYQANYNSSLSPPWGGYGPLVWAKGPTAGINSSGPYCWTLGGQLVDGPNNLFTVFTNGGFQLLTGNTTKGNGWLDETAFQPGARVYAARWTYQNKLFLFGGDEPGISSDIYSWSGTAWKQEFSTKPVAYGIRGTPSASNWPPPLAASAFAFDGNQTLWLYGGFSGVYWNVTSAQDTLWSFDVVANQWTWRAGSNTTRPTPPTPGSAPQPAGGMSMWIDVSGDVWIYGGWAAWYPTEMWKFSVASNAWTRILNYTDSNVSNANPNYGPLNQWSTSYFPGSRYAPVYWPDPTRQLFFLALGGMSDAKHMLFEDFWAFNPATLEWAWIFGDSGLGPTAPYLASYIDRQRPMHRVEAGWDVDESGTNIYIHGGDIGGPLGGYFITDLYLITISNLPPTAPPVTTSQVPVPTTSSPPNTTVFIPCTGVAPLLNAQCISGVWQVTGNVNVSGAVDISNYTILVIGNISLLNTSTLVLTDTSSIGVSGCVEFDGSVQLTLTNATSGDVVPILVSNSSCLLFAPNGSDPVVVDASRSTKKCRHLRGRYTSDQRQLSVLISIENKCKKLKWWVYLLIGIGVVLVVCAITLGIVLYLRERSQERTRTRSDSQKKIIAASLVTKQAVVK